MGLDGSFASGDTGIFRFGDQYNQISNQNGGRMVISGYHGVEITGNPAFGAPNGTALLYVHSSNTNSSGTPVVTIRGITGQTADLFQVQNNSPVTLFNVTSGGNVGIGTTSPQYLLQAGNSSISGIVARFQNSNGTCDINPTTNTLACSSDERLKKNITPMGNDLSQILALQPVFFNWNAEATGTVEHPGFIAQQVQQVMPEVVSTDPNTGLLSIGYSDLVPAMVSAMQQMQSEITTLQGGLNGNASSSNLTVYSPANFSGDSVGGAKLLAGQTSARVTFSQEYQYQPIVTITLEGNPAAIFASVNNVDSSGFTIQTLTPVTQDTVFAWHSFSSPAEKLTVSDGSIAPIVLIAPSAPVPAVIPFSNASPDSSTSASSTVDSSASSTPSVPDTSTSTPSVGPPPISIAPTPSPDASTPSPATTDTPAGSGGQ